MMITISGPADSGKTTAARLLAKKLNFSRISAGEIFREMAEEKNMSLLELSRYADEHREVDYRIEERTVGCIKTMKNAVLEGRLTGWVADKYGRPALKVWLNAALPVRAKRIANRDKKPYPFALEQIKQRDKSGRQRYRRIYNIDLNDLSIYSLIISTKNLSPEQIADKIIEKYKTVVECNSAISDGN